jgi:hypothetical protein
MLGRVSGSLETDTAAYMAVEEVVQVLPNMEALVLTEAPADVFVSSGEQEEVFPQQAQEICNG